MHKDKFSLHIIIAFFTNVKVGFFPYVKGVVLKGDVIDTKRNDGILHKNLNFKNN
jgi:hypothetical protein